MKKLIILEILDNVPTNLSLLFGLFRLDFEANS